MQQYVVAKSFIVGEIDKRLLSSQVVSFDGTNLQVGDRTYVAPGIIAAIKSGWLLSTDGKELPDNSNKSTSQEVKSQALLDKFKVVPQNASDPELPKKKPPHVLDFTNKVISDEDEDNLPLDVALPSIKSKKAARDGLKNKPLEEIPELDVLSDGGSAPNFERLPKPVQKKSGLPNIEPSTTDVFGGIDFDKATKNPVSTDTLEVLPSPVENHSNDKPEKISKRKNARVAKQEHEELANQLQAEALVQPDQEVVPFDWKNMSFKDRKDFVENTTSVSLLRELMLVEKGAVKKFIASKLENLSKDA